jgi:hypothetical protein
MQRSLSDILSRFIMAFSICFGKLTHFLSVTSNRVIYYRPKFLISDDDHMSKVSDDVAFQCLSYLRLKDIMKVSQTSKKWEDLTSHETFWRELLERDFGDGVVCNIKDGNYKLAYIQNYSRFRLIIKLLPKAKGSSLLDIEENDLSICACGLISMKSLERYIINLSKEDLGWVFYMCSNFGFTYLVKALLNHPKCQEVSANNFFTGLGKALSMAVKKGHIEIVKEIMKHPKFNQIGANDYYGLGRAFVIAAKGGHLEILMELMKSPRFQEIKANGDRSLGQAYVLSARIQNLRVLEEIGKHPRFLEIQPNGKWGLARAFLFTSCLELPKAMRDIMIPDLVK